MVLARDAITADRESPAIRIAIWMFFSVTVFAYCMRAVARATRVGFSLSSTGQDDYAVTVALIFALALTIAINEQVANALGEPASALGGAQVRGIQKADYAANLLYVPCVSFAKLAMLPLLLSITPVRKHRRVALILGIAFISWGASAEIVYAFQCRPPGVWDTLGGSCYNRLAWQTFFEISNILAETSLIILPCWIIERTGLRSLKKLGLMLPFSSRVIVIAASIIRIWALFRAHRTNTAADDDDQLHATWYTPIITQAVASLDIIVLCALYINQFLKSLESGFYSADDLYRRGQVELRAVPSSTSRKRLTGTEESDSEDVREGGRRGSSPPGSTREGDVLGIKDVLRE